MRKERKNEALLWFGKWTSKLGNIVFDYANSVSIVGAFAHAPWVLALYQSSETVIQIVFNLIGGAKADSGSRKKILIVTDVLSAAICLAVSFFVASPRMAEVVIAANALLAVVYAFNSPTYRSIVREMVDGERIGMYNSVSNGGGEVIKIAGPMAGMLLVRWIGVRGALLFDALTFLLSAVSEMLLMPISDTQRKPAQKKNIFRDIAEGFTYLVRERQLLFLILLSALVNFFLAGFNLLCPYTDVMYVSFGIEFYSKVLIMEAAGGLLGSLISSRLGSRVKENARLMVLFLGAMGAALALEPLAALTGSAIVCLIPFLLSGTALRFSTFSSCRMSSFARTRRISGACSASSLPWRCCSCRWARLFSPSCSIRRVPRVSPWSAAGSFYLPPPGLSSSGATRQKRNNKTGGQDVIPVRRFLRMDLKALFPAVQDQCRSGR